MLSELLDDACVMEPTVHFDTTFDGETVRQLLAKSLPVDMQIPMLIANLRAQLDAGFSKAQVQRDNMSASLAFAIDALRRVGTQYTVWGNDPNVRALLEMAGTVTVASTHGNLLYSAGRWLEEGRHLFEVAPCLAERLRYTELRGIRSMDVKLPFRSIYIDVPATADLSVYNEETGQHWLRGLYVSEEEPSDIRILRILAVGNWSRLPGGIYDDALAHVTLRLTTPDQLVHNSLEESLYSPNNPRKDLLDRTGPQWSETLEWLLNLLIYATSSQARLDTVDTTAERERLRRLIRVLPKRKCAAAEQQLATLQRGKVVLGADVRPFSDEIRTGLKGGRKLLARFLRMGHWRQQACGPGRTQRRQIWIEPHWVGPKKAQLTASDHIIR